MLAVDSPAHLSVIPGPGRAVRSGRHAYILSVYAHHTHCTVLTTVWLPEILSVYL